MRTIDDQIAELQERLSHLRPLDARAVTDLNRSYDVLITYTSNAIEGSTLTHGETATLIEKGVTVGGKPLRDHLTAADHYAAMGWAREIATSKTPIDERLICELHRRIVLRSDPEIGGRYADAPRRAVGTATVYPAYSKIPKLMAALSERSMASVATVATAFQAHLDIASIHLFRDGNGRAARLLMNLILIRAGFPPMSIGPEVRTAYIGALEAHQTGSDLEAYPLFMKQRLLATLEEYLSVVAPPG